MFAIKGPVLNSLQSICENEWNIKSDGDVDKFGSYFYLVEIPEHSGERAEMFAACEVGHEYDDGWKQYPAPIQGFYLVFVDSYGLWSAYHGEEIAVFERYDRLEKLFAKILTLDNEESI